MSSLNQCNFIGNPGADAEIRTFHSGDRIANLRIAVTEKWKDKQSGERKERTEWVAIVLRAGLVDVAEKYLRKGSKVYVRSEEHTSELQSLMRISYAVFCLKKKTKTQITVRKLYSYSTSPIIIY